MHPRLRYLILAATTLLLSVTSPLLPLTSYFAPPPAQAQTNQNRKAEAQRLYQEGAKPFNRGRIGEALEIYQGALFSFGAIGDRIPLPSQ